MAWRDYTGAAAQGFERGFFGTNELAKGRLAQRVAKSQADKLRLEQEKTAMEASDRRMAAAADRAAQSNRSRLDFLRERGATPEEWQGLSLVERMKAVANKTTAAPPKPKDQSMSDAQVLEFVTKNPDDPLAKALVPRMTRILQSMDMGPIPGTQAPPATGGPAAKAPIRPAQKKMKKPKSDPQGLYP